MKRKHKSKRYFIMIGILFLLICAGIFVQFTPMGYRMTVPYRNFEKIEGNVYIDNTFSGDKNEVIDIIDKAKARVLDFWGELKSSPVIIISDNTNTTKKLGGDHDTTLLVFRGAHCYISISDEYLNVDIVAHEITHAEFYERLYSGMIWPKALVPTWFDEGVATQNDYREQYSEETWHEKTDSGINVIPLEQMDTASKFYAGDVEEKRFRYMISRHEVKNWIERNGMDGLLSLTKKVNQGENFHTLYGAS